MTPSDAQSGEPEAGSRLFTSHASQDAELANRLVLECEQRDFPCWIAPRDVEPGAPYAAEIVRGIDECHALILILSAHAIASSHVRRELELAASKQRRILALRVDAAPLSGAFQYFLNESQWIELQ